jgi:hypothetical protein
MRRKTVGLALMLVFMLMFSNATYATSLDDVTQGTSSAVVETQAASLTETTSGTQAAQTESIEQYVDETIADSSNSFANQLVNTTNLSKTTVRTEAFSKRVNAVCTVIFQYLASIGAGLYLITIALDMLYVIVPPLRSFLANGYVGNGASGMVADQQQWAHLAWQTQ